MIRLKQFIVFFAIGSFMLIAALMRDRSLPANSDASIANGEKYIVVIIPSYNNSKWYKLNLGTLFQQRYNNYRVIYIDDCSSDGTCNLVKDYIKLCGQENRVTLTKNNERCGALYNLYHAIHSCPDQAIIVTLDGDDWLKGTDVLQTINHAYDDSNVLLTYGQFEEFPRGSLGICHPMPDQVVSTKSYRKQPWFTSHLRTFYAWLFKRVNRQDLLLGDEFFSVAWDQAFLFPMLEMADGRIKFIDKIMYVYNQANPLNDFKQQLRKQLYCEQIIRQRQRYQPLSDCDAQAVCVA